MASATHFVGTNLRSVPKWILRANKFNPALHLGFSLRRSCPDTGGGIDHPHPLLGSLASTCTNILLGRPLARLCRVQRSARSLTTTARPSTEVDRGTVGFHRHRRRYLSDDARVCREQFAVTGSLLDARRAGEDCPLPGQFLAVSHAFGPEAVAAFAAHVGDNNPIHLDEEFARSIGPEFVGSRNGVPMAFTPESPPAQGESSSRPRTYEGRIVHGLLVAGLFSTAFGRAISGALYVSQSLRFERPVLVGQRVDARVEVEQARATSTRQEVLVRCSTVVSLSDGSVAVSGEAKVLLPRDWEVRC